MIILGRRLNGKPWLCSIASNTSAPNSTPPALTGISFSQPQAIPSAMVGSTAAGKFICATFDAIGGVGPFLYESDPLDAGGFTAIGTDNSIFTGVTDRGRIVIPYDAGKTTAKTLKVTDATGATTTQAVNFATSNLAGIYIGANRTWPSNVDPYTLSIPVALWTGSAVDTATAITVTDPAGYFVFAYGGISLISVNNFPPPGTYPITVNAAGYTSQSFNLVMTAAACGTPYFVQTLSPVSTSVLPGTVVGKILCTTPNNSFTVTIADPSGTLAADGYNVYVAQLPAAAGAIRFGFTVTDRGLSSSSTAGLTIVPGTTLPASNMSFAGLTTAFNNDTWNNVIGTPAIAGVTGTKQWTLANQTGLNPLAINSPFGTSPPRYQIDKSTGAITAPAVLSAGLDGSSAVTDTLVISCTDGINTCTAPLNITVSWAPVSRTFYVGRGMAASRGANGFEHIVDLRKQIAPSDQAPHAGTYRVLIYADADPDYYTNDTGITNSDYAARFPWSGPIIIEGVAANGAQQPRMGGPSANNVAGGSDMRGKGFWVFGNGDALIKNVEISGCHDAITDGSHGVEAIRKDGETYGNLIVQRCWLHDNDNNLLSGVCHGTFLAEYNLIDNAGTSYVSSGATHNAYIGEMGKATFRYNVSRRSNNGYHLKCRAQFTEAYNNRFFDGLSGSASACVDLPYAGQALIYNNVFEKGPMALGPDTIRYGEEGYVWDTNTLSVHDNTISVLTMAGAHYSPSSAVGFYYGTNTKGVGGAVSLANNAVYLAPGAVLINQNNNPPASSMVVSGTTTLALPPPIDTTRPDLTGPMPSTGPLYRHLSYGQDSFVHFDGAYQYQDRDQIQVPRTAAVGTILCTSFATNQLGDRGAGTPNPFGAGTVWSIVTDPTWAGSRPWATAGKYAVTSNADGSATLKVAGALTSGVDWVQLRATAPNGTISDSRYAIVTT